MKIVYFASLRQRIGCGEETVDPPAGIDRVAGLVDWLKSRSPAHKGALEGCPRLMVAINQDYADLDAPVAANDEVAFFPPVTGG
jgi:molybdopterin synthase sulfur carrier subunit